MATQQPARAIPLPTTLGLLTVAVTFFLRHWLPGGAILKVLQLLIINFLLWHIYQTQIHPRYISNFRNLPRARGGPPLIGHGAAAFTHPRGVLFHEMMDTIPNTGLIYFQGFWQADHLLLANSRAIFDVLVRNSYAYIKPPEGKGIMRRVIGDALFVSDGTEHKRLRKIMQPLYSFTDFQNHSRVFWSKGLALNRALERTASRNKDGNLVADISEWSTKATADAVGELIMGRDLKTLEQSNEILEAFLVFASGRNKVQMALMALEVFMPSFILSRIPGGLERRINSTGVTLKYYCNKFLEERKVEVENSPGEDVFAQLIQGGTLDDDELSDVLRETFSAGVEAGAKQMVWVLWYIAEHPDWQSRLREEVKKNVQCDPVTGELEDAPLDTMPILNAILHESMRLMPVTPVVTRVADKDTTILDTVVPKGTKIFISAYAMQHSKHFYGPTAEVFDPSRWIDEDGKFNKHGGALDKYAFAVFGHGTRTCLGSSYIMAELRAFMATFVKRFEFGMAVKGEVLHHSGMLAVSPREGLKLEMKVIENSARDGNPLEDRREGSH